MLQSLKMFFLLFEDLAYARYQDILCLDPVLTLVLILKDPKFEVVNPKIGL